MFLSYEFESAVVEMQLPFRRATHTAQSDARGSVKIRYVCLKILRFTSTDRCQRYPRVSRVEPVCETRESLEDTYLRSDSCPCNFKCLCVTRSVSCSDTSAGVG